jgi:hypothetical protein
VWQAVLRLNAPGLAIADADIVNHGVELPEPVRLIGDAARSIERRHVTFNDCLGVRQGHAGIIGPLAIAGVKDDMMALVGEQLAGHEAQSLG